MRKHGHEEHGAAGRNTSQAQPVKATEEAKEEEQEEQWRQEQAAAEQVARNEERTRTKASNVTLQGKFSFVNTTQGFFETCEEWWFLPSLAGHATVPKKSVVSARARWPRQGVGESNISRYVINGM